MKAYILSIAGIVLISAIVTMICPGGRMGKFVKGTTRLFVLVVMIAPVIGWLKTGELNLPAGSAAVDEDYLVSCARLLEERDREEIGGFLREEFALSAEVAPKREISAYFPLAKITVRLDLSGINGEEARIYMMSRVEEALETRYKTEAEVYDGFPR